MSEILKSEKKKRKFSLFDNLVGILIVGYFLIVGGQALGDYVIEPGLAAVLAALIPGLTDGAAWVTATLYVGFLGIWAVTLLVMFLTSRNRPMLKALGTKTKGNTLKMFAVGLGIGLGMNLLCALIAILHGADNRSLLLGSFCGASKMKKGLSNKSVIPLPHSGKCSHVPINMFCFLSSGFLNELPQ